MRVWKYKDYESFYSEGMLHLQDIPSADFISYPQ